MAVKTKIGHLLNRNSPFPEDCTILSRYMNAIAGQGKRYMSFISFFCSCIFFLRTIVLILVLVSARPVFAQTRPIQ